MKQNAQNIRKKSLKRATHSHMSITDQSQRSKMEEELNQILQRHKSELSKLTTVELASQNQTKKNNHPTKTNDNQQEKLLHKFQSIGIDGEGPFSSSSYSPKDQVSSMTLNPPERMSIHELVYNSMITGNTPQEDESFVNERLSSNTTLKIITVISFLCQETYELEEIAFSSILQGLILFGTNPLIPKTNTTSKSDMPEEELESLVARMSQKLKNKREVELLYYIGKYLFFLQGVCNFTLRCQRLIRNIVCQLASIVVLNDKFDNNYDDDEEDCTSNTSSTINALPLGEALCTLLRILIIIDVAISSNKDLLEAWELYKQVFKKKWRNNNYTKREKQLYESLERLLLQLDISLLASRSFLTAIEQNLDPIDNTNDDIPQYRTNTALHEEMKSYIFSLYHKYSKTNLSIASLEACDTTQPNEIPNIIGVYGMYALYRRLIPPYVNPDTSMHKLLSCKNTSPLISVMGTNLCFCPIEFLGKYAPLHTAVNEDSSSNTGDITNYVTLLDKSITILSKGYQEQTLQWILKIDSDFAPLPSFKNMKKCSKLIKRKIILLLKGLLLSNNISHLIQSFLLYHKQYKIPININLLPHIYKLIVCLKSIEKTACCRRYGAIISLNQVMVRCLASDIFQCFDSLRSFIDQSTANTVDGGGDVRKKRLYLIACCLNVLEGILMGSATYSQSRRYVNDAFILLWLMKFL